MSRRRARTPIPRTRPAVSSPPAPRATVEQLATAAAHDLATFRATLELEAELVQGLAERRQLDPDLRLHLLRLIATSRALSHIGAHFVEILKSDPSRDPEQPVALADLLTQARTLFWERAARRGLQLRFEPPPRILLLEHGELVRHLLLNLLDNAIKFSGRGAVQLRVRWDPPTGLRLLVRDEGGAEAPDGAGFGMGLALLRELLRPLGGTLVRDTTAAGTQVVASVPLRAQPQAAGSPDQLRGARVVLACDDKDACRAYVSQLRRAGAGWVSTRLGDEAVRVAATLSPAAILIVSGQAAAVRPAISHLKKLALPVVLVSARRPNLRGASNIRWVHAGPSAPQQAVEALTEVVLPPAGRE